MGANKFNSWGIGNGKTDHRRSQHNGLKYVYSKLECSTGMQLYMCWKESFLVCYFDYVLYNFNNHFQDWNILVKRDLCTLKLPQSMCLWMKNAQLNLAPSSIANELAPSWFISNVNICLFNIFILEIGVSTAVLIVFRPRLSKNKKMAKLRWGSNRTSTPGLLDFSFWKW